MNFSANVSTVGNYYIKLIVHIYIVSEKIATECSYRENVDLNNVGIVADVNVTVGNEQSCYAKRATATAGLRQMPLPVPLGRSHAQCDRAERVLKWIKF